MLGNNSQNEPSWTSSLSSPLVNQPPLSTIFFLQEILLMEKKKTKIKMKITFRIKFGEHFFSRVSRKKHLRPGDARTNLHLNIIVTRGQIRRKKKNTKMSGSFCVVRFRPVLVSLRHSSSRCPIHRLPWRHHPKGGTTRPTAHHVVPSCGFHGKEIEPKRS